MTNTPAVSVIVPVYNEVGTIEPCLDHLLDQTYPRESYEVIVVDNGSTDTTTDVVEAYPVRLVSAPEAGQYAARNAGIDRASGDILSFTDADVRVAADWIESGVRALERAEPETVVYGHIRPGIDGRPNPWEAYDIVHSFGEGQRQTWNLFTTAPVFDRIGSFGGQYLSGGDIEWADRAEAAGIPVHHDETVSGTHPPRDGPRSLFRMHVRRGFGDGQRLQSNIGDSTATLLAKEPLRLADWYLGTLGAICRGADWIDLSLADRVFCAAICLPLGLGLAYGRLRGLLENDPDRSVGDYR